jgi:hypothetical protein
VVCGRSSCISIAEVAAARDGKSGRHAGLPIFGEVQKVLRRLRSVLPRPRSIHFQMKPGSIWLCAAGVCSAAVAVGAILLWSLVGLASIAVVIYGLPLTLALTFVGLTVRAGQRAALLGCFLVIGLFVLLMACMLFISKELRYFRDLNCDVQTEIPERGWNSSYKVAFKDFYLFPRGTMTTPEGAAIGFSCGSPGGRGGQTLSCKRKAPSGSEGFWMSLETSQYPELSMRGGMPETNEQFSGYCAKGG